MTDWSHCSDNAMATFPKGEACFNYFWNNPTVSEVRLQSKITWGLLKILVPWPHPRPRRDISSSICCCSVPDPMDCSMPGFHVHQQLLELAQILVHWVSDTIQVSHPLSSPSPAFNLSQHQGLFQWVHSSHQVANVLELQLQHQTFQRILRVDFL